MRKAFSDTGVLAPSSTSSSSPVRDRDDPFVLGLLSPSAFLLLLLGLASKGPETREGFVIGDLSPVLVFSFGREVALDTLSAVFPRMPELVRGRRGVASGCVPSNPGLSSDESSSLDRSRGFEWWGRRGRVFE